jgi:hypothetical protein
MTRRRLATLATVGILLIASGVLLGAGVTQLLDLPPRDSQSLVSILQSVERKGLGVIQSAEYERVWWRISGVWEIVACKDRCMELHIDPKSGQEVHRKSEELKDELPPPNAQSPSAIAKAFEVSNRGLITEIEFENGAWQLKFRESRGLLAALQPYKRRVVQPGETS